MEREQNIILFIAQIYSTRVNGKYDTQMQNDTNNITNWLKAKKE